MFLPLSSIAVINRQRKTMDLKKLEELAESIRDLTEVLASTGGLLHPIVVRTPHEDEKELLKEGQLKVLVAGGRRYAAHMMLKRSEIAATDISELDPISAEIAELDENLKRANINWDEEVTARARIHALRQAQNPGQTLAQTEKEINPDGKVSGQLSRDLKLHRAMQVDPSLKQATGKASALRILAHKEHVNERARIVSKAVNSDITAKLFTADGATFIRTLDTNSVDLVFSDLPYMIDYFETSEAGQNMKGQYDDSPDACRDFIIDILPEMGRVVKPTGWIILFMCYEWHKWLDTHLNNVCMIHYEYRDHKGKTECNHKGGSEAKCWFLKCEMPPWIWTRRGKGNHGHWPELHASNRYEMLVVANAGSAKLLKTATYPHENVLDFEPVPSADRFHAMQKPLELCQEIIGRTTIPGELVLDICMGSGAHLAAAAAKGRDFLGCDKNPDNLASALTLVSQHYHRAPALVQGEPK